MQHTPLFSQSARFSPKPSICCAIAAMQEMSSVSGQWGGEEFQQTLECLTGLTGLQLRSSVPAMRDPSALLACSRLQWLDDSTWRSTLNPDVWPDSLRAARVSWRQLLTGSWPAGCLEELQHLCITGSTSQWYIGLPAHQKLAWPAFWEWATNAPALCVLQVCTVLCSA